MEGIGAGSFRSQVQLVLAGAFMLAGPRAILKAGLQEYGC